MIANLTIGLLSGWILTAHVVIFQRINILNRRIAR